MNKRKKHFTKRQGNGIEMTKEKVTYIDQPYKLKRRQKLYRALKVIMDFIIAFVALLLLSPLFLIVAIAIKADSKGPVFFKQKRIGKNGKEFTCIKFRSMSMEARHDVAGYEYAEVNAYITKVGAFLRKFSIDELPQLFCMLSGKMSLIGYRPSQGCETVLNNAREEYGLYQIRPGITGWAQVNGRDVLAAQPEKKAKYDAYYLTKYSIWLDIKIFFMTIGKVFKHEDIEEGVLNVEESPSAEIAVTEECVVDISDIDNEKLKSELDKNPQKSEKYFDKKEKKAV